MNKSRPRSRVLSLLVLIAGATPGFGQFSPGPDPITGTVTTKQTLASGTGTVNGTLSVSGGNVAITVTGSSTIVNNGTITQTGTDRAIRDNTGGLSLTVLNKAGALIRTADSDPIQMNKANSDITLDNDGTITSLNASKGGAQAIDWNAITSGANILNNHLGGSLLASDADVVRPGVNGVVNNDGTILGTVTTDTGSDGIDAQTNSGIQIVNAFSASNGLIQGARHGITGGNTTTGVYTMSVTNNLGGTIRGANGAGINIDGINGKEKVTVVNAGTITGNGITGDGDGIDVDGLIDLNNSGTIRSINAFSATAPAQSEGVTIGGGTIVNSGLIEGDVASGNANAIGRGITIAGIDTSGTPEPIYGKTTITNTSTGVIKGQTDSGLAVLGGASGFTVSIDNRGTIEGGGATAAAIQTGADDDTVINSGQVIADHSGKAIDLGAGNDTLTLSGGAAKVVGNVSGGTGSNALVFDPGAKQTFSYDGSFSNFSTTEVKSGAVKLFGASTLTGTTTVSGGTLFADNTIGSATGSSTVTVKNQGSLSGRGTIGGNVWVESGGTIAPGDGVGTLTITGNLTLLAASHFLFELGQTSSESDKIVVSGALVFSGNGSVVLDFVNGGVTAGTYTLLTFENESGLDLSTFSLGETPGFSGHLTLDAHALSITVTPVPEASTATAMMSLLAVLGVLRLRARKRTF